MTDQAMVRNNGAESRYELDISDAVAFADYQRRDGALVFTHTQVPPGHEGEGVGTRLVEGALADARAQDLKVVPICAFVADYIDRHPEEQDLLALDAPG